MDDNIEALSNEETAALFPVREGESLEECLARTLPDPASLPLVPADSEVDAAAVAIVSRIEQLEQEPEASNWNPPTQHEVLMLLTYRDHPSFATVPRRPVANQVRARGSCVFHVAPNPAHGKRKKRSGEASTSADALDEWIKPNSATGLGGGSLWYSDPDAPHHKVVKVTASLSAEQKRQYGDKTIHHYCLMHADVPVDSATKNVGSAKTPCKHLHDPVRWLVVSTKDEPLQDAQPAPLALPAGPSSSAAGGDAAQAKQNASFGTVEVDELRIGGVDVWGELTRLKRELALLQQQPDGRDAWTSSRADLAEWMEKLDHSEHVRAGDVVQVRGERLTKAITFEPGGTLFVVSSDPALAFNLPEDTAQREHGAVLAFVGRVPVHCVGDAPVDSYLVPSGGGDGAARAVPWEELERDLQLRAQCFGVVWATLHPDADGRPRVLAFVSAHPVPFGAFRNVERVAPLSSALVPRPPPRDALLLRPYQTEAIERATRENTIVCLETGLGKTLIAVRLIDHFIDVGKALFIAPTVVLVEQQARVCREQCAHSLRVVELCGSRQGDWTRASWTRCLAESDVLVGTPEIFRSALVDSGCLSLTAFGLVIFDEVHHAVGGDPMACIMYDAYHLMRQAGKSAPMRIVGLTASFASGRLTNLSAKRQQLEVRMDAAMFRPGVPPEYLVEPTFAPRVEWAADGLARYESLARSKVETLFREFDGMPTKVKDLERLVQRAGHVLLECGMMGFIFYLGESLAYQLEGIAIKLSEIPYAPALHEKARRLCSVLPQLRAGLRDAARKLQADGELTGAPCISSKCTRLLELLGELFREHGATRGYKGIIFVEQVSLTFPLAHVINQHHPQSASSAARRAIRAQAISGVGTMSSARRSDVLDGFKRGRTSVLVATAALEEGIDVSDCQFVIRYSKFNTSKSHIQGAGRARHEDAEVFYFENDPEDEAAKAQKMAECARNEDVKLSEAQRLERAEVRSIDGFYPYAPCATGGVVNIYNCVGIFQSYCGKVLGQSLNLDTSGICVQAMEASTHPYGAPTR